jgi:hypothetical protein
MVNGYRRYRFKRAGRRPKPPGRTDARIESIKRALGLTDETREQNARQNLDRALIEIEHNEGRADADCTRTISRVVGQLATVEWILRDEDE